MMDDINSEHLEPFRRRTASEAAQRCLVLYTVVAAKRETIREHLIDWLRQEMLWEAVSPMEAAFLHCELPAGYQAMDVTRYVEALPPLLWALHHIDNPPVETARCDLALIHAALPPLFGATTEFLSAAMLRDPMEIDEELERIYQVHWAARDAVIHGEMSVSADQLTIIEARHRALNWLVGYCNQDWDDVSTDT